MTTGNFFWNLPRWLPMGLRNFILNFEADDKATFEFNCKRIAMRRYGVSGDWKLVAFAICWSASKQGISHQKLAAECADSPNKEILYD